MIDNKLPLDIYYKFAWRGQGSVKRTQASPLFFNNLSKSKKASPQLFFDGSDSYNARIVVADFDSIPEGLQSFNQLEGILNKLDCTVARSQSDKRKAFFLWFHNGAVDNAANRRAFLKSVLPTQLFESIDTSSVALKATFANESVYNAVTTLVNTHSDKINTIKKQTVFKLVDLNADKRDQYEYHIRNTGERYTTTFDFYANEEDYLYDETLKKFVGRSPVKKKLMQLLVASHTLLNGMTFSTGYMANSLECDKRYLSRCIKELIKLGLLEKTSNPVKFVVGTGYRAEGALKNAIARHKGVEAIPAYDIPMQPEDIILQDGNTNEQLLRLSNNFNRYFSCGSIFEWENYLRRIPNIDVKNRLERSINLGYRRIKFYAQQQGLIQLQA